MNSVNFVNFAGFRGRLAGALARAFSTVLCAALCPALCTALFTTLAACSGGGDASIPGDADDRQPYGEIARDDTVHFTGTEPFWGGEAVGRTLTYTTPEKPDGWTFAVDRFAGRGGIAFSGLLDGNSFVLAVTPGKCSDGMSDRTYPYVTTLQIEGEKAGRLVEDTRTGCAWTDTRPFVGPQQP